MRKDEPSRTAYKVAQNVIVLGSKSGMDSILPVGSAEATAKLLLASGVASERMIRWLQSPAMVGVYQWFDWMLPGQFEAFAHRKAFCESQTRAGIASGAEQVLVLGAGYDTMAWRLAPEFPQVKFWEIDHPATADRKAKAISQLGKPDNLTLLSENLGEKNLTAVLHANKLWDPNKQTVIVAEGLLMYLPVAAVKQLFRRCDAFTGPKSRLVFTYLSTANDGRPDAGPYTGLLTWILKLSGEPWLWSIPPNDLSSFLEDLGWRKASDQAATAAKHGIEYFAVAEK